MPDGTAIEGVGIPPDVPVDGDFRTHDPVLEKALELAAPFLHDGNIRDGVEGGDGVTTD
jgi:C-terminal processing protease CtpA/Prc